MRLPLRHPPSGRDAAPVRCAHLEALAEAALGLPLGPAADAVTARRSRGRFGNALQWHLGLEPHDGLPTRDWEDRIEVKIVTVWGRGDRIACDKLKVCDLALDPWHKLANVLWVLVDRVTHVVVGHRFSTLAGAPRVALEASWGLDPHFDRPPLFVEAREQDDRQAPAYYLASSWLHDAGIVPAALRGVYVHDAAWWTQARATHRRGPPLLTILRSEGEGELRCARCGGKIHVDVVAVRARGGAPAVHALADASECALRAHYVIDARGLVLPADHPGRAELEAGIEGRVGAHRVWRLADRVLEPEDHLHG